ncbi:3-carboxy-cis,cis-muconate cycloisomerase [Microbacterium endophyticum]|uniref:3-carboxy-cis,cis-muconate cycloisomerase n=1 Tax=Microbacterium endophyticum TaxID=1526412 RepID=A0A7W4YMP7_9MICO|nr:3-carboxy-cis,cis-muconate cycloisomerase [Microbacterium endophyticum]NIK36197.1 3-carboxy-cis,cis-muconate cycloisomerase [Microbacterium endophyticum]
MSDRAVLDALVTAEVALVRAWQHVGVAPVSAEAEVSAALGWVDTKHGCRDHGIDLGALAAQSVAGGNPVIPLVGALRSIVPESARGWVHRGTTSQDILDSALMVVASHAVAQILADLTAAESALQDFIRAHGDSVAAARTLTQHAVPTTLGARAGGWLNGIRRARVRLEAVELPAQLAGAGGTLAAIGEIAEASGAAGAVESALVAAYADGLGLAAPTAPWHTSRWPVTELGDALVQAIDALGKVATDVATASRTEIGELLEGTGGGSSAMPQKQNPVRSVLIRSAALRAPLLGATLHTASAFAADERPDGAWHAEWPTLRELVRLALGASAHGAELLRGLRVDDDAVARNLALTGGLIVSERLGIVLTPLIGAARFKDLIAAASAGGDLAALITALPEAAGLDVDALLDPAHYTGAAASIAARALDPESDR